MGLKAGGCDQLMRKRGNKIVNGQNYGRTKFENKVDKDSLKAAEELYTGLY